MLKFAQQARLPAGHPPVMLVVVDTEEEFPWDKPFDRSQTGTTTIAAQASIHEQVYDGFGIVPTYVVDYPVASTPAAVQHLRALMEAGRCEIGAHLHPWVSPPHVEEVNTFNSYAGNLPRELEYNKLKTLTETITASFGRAPSTFKAGRYGVGPNTAEIVASLGYLVDASVVPYTAFRADGGPDFSTFDEHPFWFSAGGRQLLELPVTTGYCGWLRSAGPTLHALAHSSVGRAAKLGGVFARARMMERIRLSPEGAVASDLIRVSRDLHAHGCQVFSLTYHSPSLKAGHTPYVRTERELEQFIGSIAEYCRYFKDELGGVFLSVSQLHALLQEQQTSQRVAA